MFTLFVITYATERLDVPRRTVLNAVFVAAVVHLATIPLWGAVGPFRPPAALPPGSVGVGIWTFLFFPLVDNGNFVVIVFAISAGLLLHGTMYGPRAAFFSELFSTRARYKGASVGYQLSSVFAGSLAPVISGALLARYGSPRRSRSTCSSPRWSPAPRWAFRARPRTASSTRRAARATSSTPRSTSRRASRAAG